MLQSRYRQLSCPIINQATAGDAKQVVHVLLNSNYDLVASAFGPEVEKGQRLLEEHYSKHFQDLYVLREGEEIIAVMKVHLPDSQSRSIGFNAFIRNLGLRRGIRAAFLFAHWDEYNARPREIYLEFLRVRNDYRGYGCEELLIGKAEELGSRAGGKYLTIYIPSKGYREIGPLESAGFIGRKVLSSPIARIFGATHKWQKFTFTLYDGPLTVREHAVHAYTRMRSRWLQKRHEVISAIRLAAILSVVPITAGLFAYFRGFELAAAGWLILLVLHIIGTIMFFRQSVIGKWAISFAMISESANLIMRAVMTDRWIDRGWLLPLSLLNLWILFSVFSTPVNFVHYEPQLSKSE